MDYYSVMNTVQILEAKCYLPKEKDGRAHVYSPIVGRKEASRLEVQRLVNRFFGNSHEELVLNVIEDESLDAGGLGRLRQLLDGGNLFHGDGILLIAEFAGNLFRANCERCVGGPF